METGYLTESAILSSLLVILSVILIGTGIGGALYIDFIVPMIIMIIYHRCGLKWTILAGVNTLCIVALGLGYFVTSVRMLQSILIGIWGGYLLKYNAKLMDHLLIASLGGCFIMLIMDIFLRILTGVSVLDDVAITLFGLEQDVAFKEILYYLSIASLPIGTMVSVYVCTLLVMKRLKLLDGRTTNHFKVLKNFFKYRPFIYCSRKTLILGVLYTGLISMLPMSSRAYIKALVITTQYIVLYFIIADYWGLLSQWCYMKLKSPVLTSIVLLMMMIGFVKYFSLFLHGLIGIGVILDLTTKIHQEQDMKLNNLLNLN